MKTIATLIVMAACVAGWLYSNHRDYQEAVARDAAHNYRRWLANNCIPTVPNTRSVIEMRSDGTTQCTHYENAGYGRAPQVAFAEVWQ